MLNNTEANRLPQQCMRNMSNFKKKTIAYDAPTIRALAVHACANNHVC